MVGPQLCNTCVQTEYYNDAVNEELFTNKDFVRHSYRTWVEDRSTLKRRREMAGGAAEMEDWQPESYISYPFVIAPATKAEVMHDWTRGTKFSSSILTA